MICTQYCFFWCPPQWLPTDWIKLLKHNITSGDELCLPMCVYGRARGVVDSYTWFLIYAIPYTSFRMSLIIWWVIFKFFRICQRNCINCNNLNDMYKMSHFSFPIIRLTQAHSYSLQSSSKYGSDNELTYVSATERSTASDWAVRSFHDDNKCDFFHPSVSTHYK